jgi:cytochrome c biogenesis protein CcdA
LPEELTLAVVLGAAVVDSVNPCAIGVILFLASVLLRVSDRRAALLRFGGVYIATVFVVYMLSGLGLVWFQHALIERGFAEIVGIAVGVVVVVLGLIELGDAFWHGRAPSLEISPRHRERLVRMTDRITLLGVVGMGGFVALVELPCTGGPYLAITALLARSFDLEAFVYLLIYNAIFVLPLLAILVLVALGFSTAALKRWRQVNRKWMNLALGTLMVVLGSFLVVHYAAGWRS